METQRTRNDEYGGGNGLVLPREFLCVLRASVLNLFF